MNYEILVYCSLNLIYILNSSERDEECLKIEKDIRCKDKYYYLYKYMIMTINNYIW